MSNRACCCALRIVSLSRKNAYGSLFGHAPAILPQLQPSSWIAGRATGAAPWLMLGRDVAQAFGNRGKKAGTPLALATIFAPFSHDDDACFKNALKIAAAEYVLKNWHKLKAVPTAQLTGDDRRYRPLCVIAANW